jgi:hypothetical protein
MQQRSLNAREAEWEGSFQAYIDVRHGVETMSAALEQWCNGQHDTALDAAGWSPTYRKLLLRRLKVVGFERPCQKAQKAIQKRQQREARRESHRLQARDLRTVAGRFGGRNRSHQGRVSAEGEVARLSGAMAPQLMALRQQYQQKFDKHPPTRAGVAWIKQRLG